MKGWWSIVPVVAAYDAWAIVTDKPTLSSQFRVAAHEHPVVVTTGTVYLVAHLYGYWPRRVDPFNAFVLACRAFVK